MNMKSAMSPSFMLSRIVFGIIICIAVSFPGTVLAGIIPGADLVGLDFSKEKGFALISQSELFVSTDGTSWKGAGLSKSLKVLTSVAAGKKAVLVGTKSGMIFRVTDNSGYTFFTPPKDPYNRIVAPIKMMAIAPKGAQVIASSGQGVVVSDNGGETWKAVAEPFWNDPMAREIMCVGFAGKTPVVVTRNGAYFRGKDGFTRATKGLPGKFRPSKAVADRGRVLMAIPKIGIFETKNGKSWKKLARAPDNPIAFLGYTARGYLASAPFSDLYEGDSKGKKWAKIGIFSNAFVPVASTATGSGALVAFRGKGLMLLENSKLLSVELPRQLASVNALIDLSGSLLAGTQGGVYLSSDGGNTWDDITPSTLGAPVTDFLSVSDGRLYMASMGSGVFVSEDNGKTWKEWNTSLGTANSVRSIIEDSGGILAATENGLMWRSLGDETAWKFDSRGVPRVPVMDIMQTEKGPVITISSDLFTLSAKGRFQPVKSPGGQVRSVSARKGKILVLSGNRLFSGDLKGKLKELPMLPKGVSATSVLLRGEKTYAGTTEGVYALVSGAWKRVGKETRPVQKLYNETGSIRAVTSGAGSYNISPVP